MYGGNEMPASGPASAPPGRRRWRLPSLAFHDAAAERAFWASRPVRTHLLLTDLAAVVWTVSNNTAFFASLLSATFASQPAFVR